MTEAQNPTEIKNHFCLLKIFYYMSEPADYPGGIAVGNTYVAKPVVDLDQQTDGNEELKEF